MSQDPQGAVDPARLAETGRTEAFSDGVLAIVITLLILDVRAPDSSGYAVAGVLGFVAPLVAPLTLLLTLPIFYFLTSHGLTTGARAKPA